MPSPLPVKVYQGLSRLAGPFVYPRVEQKLSSLGAHADRLKERRGYATEPRPSGPLLWCHAASVGESLSLLRLIRRFGELFENLSFLITSGTATSAQILASRLPPRTQHQFAPVDTPQAVGRFLQHWKPNAALFVESELWPNMLTLTNNASIPMVLVNARISEKSARNWTRVSKTARHLMGKFKRIHCQDTRTEAFLQKLGLTQAAHGSNLKAMSVPDTVDAGLKRDLATAIGHRPVWLASSTHPGEDAIILDAHQNLLKIHPTALLLLVPRHPDRADEIAHEVIALNMSVTQRSTGGEIEAGVHVYLADTLGETALWYALSPVTCLCGSFVPVGGHNPFEVAQGGSALIHGPLFANFEQVYQDFEQAGASLTVRNAHEIAKNVAALWENEDARLAQITKANALIATQDDQLDAIAYDLSKALELG